MQPQNSKIKTSFHYRFSSQADITELHACFPLQLMPQRKQMEWYRSEQINCRLQPPTRTDQGCDWPHTNTLDCRTRRHTPHTTYHATTTQSKMLLWTDLHIMSLYQVEGVRGEKTLNLHIYRYYLSSTVHYSKITQSFTVHTNNSCFFFVAVVHQSICATIISHNTFIKRSQYSYLHNCTKHASF